MMVRVIYETTNDCTTCLHSDGKVCLKLKKYLYDICFECDCPLPSLEKVEQFTRYITPDKELDCHGNCKNWERWEYNRHINTDLGVCMVSAGFKVCHANSKGCEEFDEI